MSSPENYLRDPPRSSASVVLVSGHMFGAAALEGILGSEAFRTQAIAVPRVFALHPRHALATTGYYDLSSIAADRQLPCTVFSSSRSNAFAASLAELHIDYLLVVGLSQLVPFGILDLPRRCNNGTALHNSRYGCIGMHPTLLPQGRGRAPIPWTILKELQTSGVTMFRLIEEADAGEIIDAVSFAIQPKATAADVLSQAWFAHRELATRLAHLMALREVTGRPQGEVGLSSWPKRRQEDGWIDFRQSAQSIVGLVRALVPPYPGAFFVYRGTTVIVHEAVVEALATDGTGVVLALNEAGKPTISAASGAVRVVSFSCAAGAPHFEIGAHVQIDFGDCVDD